MITPFKYDSFTFSGLSQRFKFYGHRVLTYSISTLLVLVPLDQKGNKIK